MPSVESHTENGGIIRISRESMGDIFPRYFERLVYFANLYLNDEEKARDAVHEMFLALWEKRHEIEFNHEKKLKTYLYKVTKGKAVDLMLKSMKEETNLRELNKYLGNAIHHPEVTDTEALMQAESIATIRKAISTLSPQCRAVMELLLEGKTQEEIGESLRMKPELVRKNKSLGVIALRKRLNNHVLISLALLILGLKEVRL